MSGKFYCSMSFIIGYDVSKGSLSFAEAPDFFSRVYFKDSDGFLHKLSGVDDVVFPVEYRKFLERLFNSYCCDSVKKEVDHFCREFLESKNKS